MSGGRLVAEDTEPVTRGTFATRDFDEAQELLTSFYGRHSTTLHGDAANFVFAMSTVEIDGLGLDDVYSGGRVDSEYSPAEGTLTVARLRSGRLAIREGDQERSVARGDLAWISPEHTQMHRSDTVTLDVIRLDLPALERVATEISGLAPGQLRFRSEPSTPEPQLRYWEAARRWVVEDVLGDDTVAGEPLIHAEVRRVLARATLLAIPNTALDLLGGTPVPALRRAEPATVRRAVEFVDANAHLDIDINQIADVARIGPRGLQAAFRKHRDQTPLEYLREVRMEGARRDLQAGDPTRGSTVAEIAGRWGFTHPGRFSVEYRRRYGRSPSRTLQE